MPEEPAIMLGKLEGMSTNINKAWLRLMFFLEIQKKKNFAFLPINNDDELTSFKCKIFHQVLMKRA